MERHVEWLVAGWIGSTNLGDELVFAGLRRKLAARGIAPSAISIDPAATRLAHGVAARGPAAAAGVLLSGRCSGVVFGGGGLLQDKTSHLNLPYHLARLAPAIGRRVPFAGVGLGVGPLETALGRSLARAAMRRAAAVSVRDQASADLLAGLGVERPIVAADLALALPRPQVEASDRIVVALRPWDGRRSIVPVARRRAEAPTPDWFIEGCAAALDGCAAATGLPVHMVALQRDRDDPVHRMVADRMRAPVTTATPTVHDVVGEIAASRVVVAMRYHAAICAALAGRPAALIGYSDKVPSLGSDLGDAAVTLAWTPSGVERLARAVGSVLDRGDAMSEAADRLRSRERRNDEVLDRLLGH